MMHFCYSFKYLLSSIFFTFLKQQNTLLGHTQGIFLKTNTHIINDFLDISAT